MIQTGIEPKRSAVLVDSEAPVHFLVMGDFGGRATPHPIAVDRDNFSSVMRGMEVKIGGLACHDLDDFHPDTLFQRLGLATASTASEKPAPKDEPVHPDIAGMIRPASLLEQIAEGGDPFEQYLKQLARSHAEPPSTADPKADAQHSEKMNTLLHHPRFQAVEAAWRGLDFAVRAAADESARIYLVQFTKKELEEDLGAATDLKSTRFYKLLHSRAWEAALALHTFDENDIELLARAALVASSAKTAFIAEGAPDMGPHWDELKAIPETTHLGLALPRFLLRLPYGAKTSRIDSFPYEEMPTNPVHGFYLWGSPAFVCLALLAREGGGLDLENLPAHSYQKDGEWLMKPCAEILLNETQILSLIDQGLMPLVSYRDTDRIKLAGFRAINGQDLPFPSWSE